jgi:hypothetical protein
LKIGNSESTDNYGHIGDVKTYNRNWESIRVHNDLVVSMLGSAEGEDYYIIGKPKPGKIIYKSNGTLANIYYGKEYECPICKSGNKHIK